MCNIETVLLLLIIIFVFVLFCDNQNENFKKTDDLICGVKNGDQLWCAWEDIFKDPKWHQITGNIKYVSLTENNELYALDKEGNLYYRNDYETDYKNPINWSIPNVPGKELKTFKQISANKDMVCAVDTDGSIYCYDKSNLIDPGWILLESPKEKKFNNVMINGNKIFAITDNNEIYYKEHYGNKTWKLVSNSLTQISFDRNLVCGIDENGEVHCFDNAKIANPNWVKIEGKKFDHILVKDGKLIGIDKNSEIFMTDNYKDDKPFWKKIPGNGLQQFDLVKGDHRWF